MPGDNATPHPSGVYDVQVRKTIPFYDRFTEETVDLVRAYAPECPVWLDTGAGTGNLVEKAYEAFPKTRFLLADPSQAMLDLAKEKLSRFGSQRIGYLPCVPTNGLKACLKTPEDRPFVITAIQSHHYMQADERAEATRVCYELLQPGGLYVTFENVRPFTDEGVRAGLERWGRFQVESGRSPEVVKAHLERFGRDYFPVTLDEHLKLLRDSGFRAAEVLWYSHMQAGFWAVK